MDSRTATGVCAEFLRTYDRGGELGKAQESGEMEQEIVEFASSYIYTPKSLQGLSLSIRAGDR